MGKNRLSTKKFISIVPFRKLLNWSVPYLTGSKIEFTTAYPMVRIGDFLSKNKTPITIEDGKEYVRVRIKTHNGGVERREKNNVLGKSIGTKKQYVISEGQFIISKIDARNGAMGIVPKDLDGAIVTQDFLPYDIDTNIINPQYLVLASTTKPFVEFCQRCSSGTTNRQRINEEEFLNMKIPVPNLDNQKLLVDSYEDDMTKATMLDIVVDKTKKDLYAWLLARLNIKECLQKNQRRILQYVRYSNLKKWSIDEIQKYAKFSFENTKYNVVRIEDVITTIEGGKTPSTRRADYWGKDVFWASAKDMKELYLLNIQDKLSQKGVEETKLTVFPKGTILGVFRSGILRHSFPVCITAHPVTINQDLKAFCIDEKKIKKLYFLFYLDIMQDMVLNIARKKGVTVESINADTFMGIPFVCPPMIVQSEIVRYIYEKKKYIYQQQEKAKQLRIQAITDFESKIFD